MRSYTSGFSAQTTDYNDRCATTPVRLQPYASACVRLKPEPWWGYYGGILGQCRFIRYPQLRNPTDEQFLAPGQWIAEDLWRRERGRRSHSHVCFRVPPEDSNGNGHFEADDEPILSSSIWQLLPTGSLVSGSHLLTPCSRCLSKCGGVPTGECSDRIIAQHFGDIGNSQPLVF